MYRKNIFSKFSKKQKTISILAIFSLAMGFVACNFSIPKSVEIQMTDSHYELPLGKLQTSKYFTSEKFLESMGTATKDFVLYDYNENGNSQDMVFLMEYNLADIPIDFADQLKNIDFNKNLGEGLSKEFNIAKPENLEFTMGETLDLNEQILSQVKTELAPFSVPVPGKDPLTGDPVTLSTAEHDAFQLVEITLDFNSPKFDYAKFSTGSLKLNLPYKTPGTTKPEGWTFKARAVVKDLDGNILVQSDDTLTDVSDGNGFIELLLDNTEFYEHIRIYVHGEVSGGPDIFNPLDIQTIEFNPNISFENAKFERLEGVTITPEQMGDAGTIEISDKTISIGDSLKAQLISTTLNGGSISFTSEAPAGWTGISCVMENFEVTGGLTLGGDDFEDEDEVPGKNFLINKSCSLNGRVFKGDDIVINGKLKIGVNEGTLVFPESGDPVSTIVSGVVEIEKFGETTVDISKIIDTSQLQKSVTQSLGSEVQNYLKGIDFSSLSFTCDFTGSELPGNNIMLNATVNSTAFDVSGMTAEDPVNLAAGNKLELKETFNPAHSYVPTTDIDADVSVSLSGSDTEHPSYVTFEEFELDKDYKMNLNIDFDFSFAEIRLDASKMGLSDKTIETGLNVDELFKSTLGDTLPADQLAKVGFHKGTATEDGTVVYLYVSKPEIEGDDPLSVLEISAKIKAVDGAAATDLAYLIGDDSTSEDLNFVSNVLNLSNFATVKEEDDKIYRLVTKPKKQLFPAGSYTDKIETFADVLNQKPKNLTINYSLSIGDGGSGEITITGDQFDKMKTAAEGDNLKSTSIQIKMIVYLPIALDVTTDKNGEGFEIPDMLGLYDNATSDDLMRRNSASDMDEVMKFIDLIDSMGITYKSNYNMNTKMVFKCLNAENLPVISKTFRMDSTSQQNFLFNTNDIKTAFETCPLYPQISISVGNGEIPGKVTTFRIPRELEITLFADIKLKEGAKISLWEQ